MRKLGLQFGMEIEDAFGMVVLMEMLFVAVSEAFFGEVIYYFIARPETEYPDDPFLLWSVLLAITAKAILFIALNWVGFVILGRSSLLRWWIIIGMIIDMSTSVLLMVTHVATSEHIPLWIILIAIAYWILFLSIRFYIYMISWTTWKYVTEGTGLRSYGQGLRHLVMSYKNEFQRVTIMLLTLEIIWNSWAALAFDLPLEIFVGITVGGKFLYRPMVAFRLARIFFASLVLYFAKKKKTICLKYSFLPFLLLSIGLGIFTPIFVYATHENPPKYAIVIGAYFTEIITSIFLNVVLSYSIIGLTFLKPCTPVPFVQAQDQEE